LDRAFVFVKEGGILTLPGDLAELRRVVQETGTRLLAIDPVAAAISLKLDAHRDQDVRVVLGELDKMAKELELSVVLVAHLNKAPSSDAYIRIGGSTAFYNACRSVITVTLDPDDEDHRLVAQHKANYSRLAAVQRHRIEQVIFEANNEPIVTSKMVYVEDAEDVDPYRVLEHREQRPLTKRDRAATLLTALLADGEWHDREPLEQIATAQDIGRRTFEMAAGTLGVESDRHGVPPRARWRLPIAQAPTSNTFAQLDETA
jgi:RecA-family ATPase